MSACLFCAGATLHGFALWAAAMDGDIFAPASLAAFVCYGLGAARRLLD